MLCTPIAQSVKINIKCLHYSKPCSGARNYMPEDTTGPIAMAMVIFFVCVYMFLYLNYYNCVVAFKVFLTKSILTPSFYLMVYTMPLLHIR